MGAIFSWIIRGLAYAGPAAVGYFFNDVATWVSGLMPQTNVRDSTGKFAWWFVLVIVAVIGAIILMVLNMFGGRKKLFCLAGMALCYAGDYFLPGISLTGFEIIAAGVLGVIPASVTDDFSIDFCPEIIIFANANVTKFQIDVKDDGNIFNLDTNGIQALEDIGFVGSDTANLNRAYRIANGYVNKTTTFTVTNGIGALTVRGFSMRKAEGGPNRKGIWTRYQTTKAFANVEFRLKDFSFAAFPSATATDIFTVEWQSGKSDNVGINELRVLLASTQFNEANGLDNRGQIVKAIRFTGAADQSVYYVKAQAVL